MVTALLMRNVCSQVNVSAHHPSSLIKWMAINAKVLVKDFLAVSTQSALQVILLNVCVRLVTREIHYMAVWI
jgi:hypothetical protein